MGDWTAADLDRIGSDGSLRRYISDLGGACLLFVRSCRGQAGESYVGP
jgi:hypothetical protein